MAKVWKPENLFFVGGNNSGNLNKVDLFGKNFSKSEIIESYFFRELSIGLFKSNVSKSSLSYSIMFLRVCSEQAPGSSKD